jgi:hypothetical protein
MSLAPKPCLPTASEPSHWPIAQALVPVTDFGLDMVPGVVGTVYFVDM